MTFLHLSDLHLGKRLGEYELYEEQRAVLWEIVELCGARRPDAVLIAGDVYDKPVPTIEAVRLFDDFLGALCDLNIPVLIISGNHDSGERLGFASGLIRKSGVYIAGAFEGAPRCVTLQDDFGPVCFWLLPFLRPATVRAAFSALGLDTEDITDYTSAIRAAIGRATPDPAVRNVLVAHQFVTCRGHSPERCDSETLNAGGLDDVDLSVFDPYDYVALGHLHGPQRIGRNTARYAGSPLPYSVSEQNHRKSVCLVKMEQKGRTEIELVGLHPLRGVRTVRGSLEELCAPDFPGREPREDYVLAQLRDEGAMQDPLARLRAVYPRLLGIELLRSGSGAAEFNAAALESARLDPMNALEEFFSGQLGRPMSRTQREIANSVFERLREEQT